jgi:hypothetical protein
VVLATVAMKNGHIAIWIVTPWNVHRCFGGRYFVHLQGRRTNQINNQQCASNKVRALLLLASVSSRQRGRPTSTNTQMSGSNKNLVLGPDGYFTPRQTRRLIIGRNMTLTYVLMRLTIWQLDNCKLNPIISITLPRRMEERKYSSKHS